MAQLENRLKSVQGSSRWHNGKENGLTGSSLLLQNGDVPHGNDLPSHNGFSDKPNVEKQLSGALQAQKLAELEVENYKGKTFI